MSLKVIGTALLLACGLLTAVPAGAWDADYGHVTRPDGVLREGCTKYGFRYRIRPGGDNWLLEMFLVAPGRERLGTIAKDSDADPKRARDAFTICRSTTRPGRFRIRGKLTMYDEGTLLSPPEEPTVKWIKPARFRLRRAR